MSDLEKIALAAILVPAVALGIVGMVRGYHLSLKVFRPRKDDHDG